MNIAEFRTDTAAAEKGRWFEFEGSRFLIAASNTPDYQRAMARRAKPHRRAFQKNDFRVINQVTVEVMADAVLLDWENVTNGDEPHPYTRANAVELLTACMEFRQWVETQAMNAANFVTEAEAADQAALKSGSAVGAPVE